MLQQRLFIRFKSQARLRGQIDIAVNRLKLLPAGKQLVAELDKWQKYSVIMKFGIPAEACTVAARPREVEL